MIRPYITVLPHRFIQLKQKDKTCTSLEHVVIDNNTKKSPAGRRCFTYFFSFTSTTEAIFHYESRQKLAPPSVTSTSPATRGPFIQQHDS